MGNLTLCGLRGFYDFMCCKYLCPGLTDLGNMQLQVDSWQLEDIVKSDIFCCFLLFAIFFMRHHLFLQNSQETKKVFGHDFNWYWLVHFTIISVVYEIYSETNLISIWWDLHSYSSLGPSFVWVVVRARVVAILWQTNQHTDTSNFQMCVGVVLSRTVSSELV